MKISHIRSSGNKALFIVTLILTILISSGLKAATYYAIADGPWNANTTWSLSSGGPAVGSGTWPVAGDIVFIGEANVDRAVTIPGAYNAQCALLTIGPTGATGDKNVSLTLADNTASLIVSSGININRAVSGIAGARLSTLNVDAGTVTVGGSVAMNGTYNQNTKAARIQLTTGSLIIMGNLALNTDDDASTNLILMDGGAGTLNLAGNLYITNNLGTLSAGLTSNFNFNGTFNAQTIPIGVSNIVYNNLLVNNTSAGGAILNTTVLPANLTGNLAVQSGKLNNNGFEITLANDRSFSVSNGATFNLSGTSSGVTVSGTGAKIFGPTSTVNYSGTNQAVTAETYGHLVLGGSGTKTLPAFTFNVAGNLTISGTTSVTTAASINVSGNVTLNAGTTFNAGSFIHNIGGNWLNHSAGFNASASTINFNGASQQTIGGTTVTSFFDIFLNNPAGVVLGINATVSNVLTLNNGKIVTGGNVFFVSNASVASIAGASPASYIHGNLHRSIADGINSYQFPIGSASSYAPVTFDFAVGTVAGVLSASTGDGDHGSIGLSDFNVMKTVNRNWSLAVISGLASVGYNATFQWASADQDAGFAYATAVCGKFDGTAWTYPVMGTLTPNSAQITGESSFSDFQTGNICMNPDLPTVIVIPPTICGGNAMLYITSGNLNDATEWVWYTGSCGGTYAGSGSLIFVSPELTTTYYVHGEGGCVTPGPCTEAVLNVSPPPTAFISGDAIICAGGSAILTIELTGTPNWSYIYTDGTDIWEVTDVTTSPSTRVVNTYETKTYTVISVTDGNDCTVSGTGSATISIGPVALAPNVYGCAGEIVEVPITVKNFKDVGAISLTMNYDKNVVQYHSFVNNAGYIEYFNANESGAEGIVRFTGIALESFDPLPDDAVLITLKFTYLGGSGILEWDDTDDTWCEFAAVAPDFVPYCDDETGIYYVSGSFTEATVTADFTANNLFPPKFTDVQLTDLSAGSISGWLWSFDRNTVNFMNGTNEFSQNPVIQFTAGGHYAVTLTVSNESCIDAETKTGYIRAGSPGVWDGPNSSDWFTETNWDDHLIPAPNLDVIIHTRPDETHNYPHHPGNLTIGTDCNSITLTGTGELSIDGILTINPGKVLDLKNNSKVTAGIVVGP